MNYVLSFIIKVVLGEKDTWKQRSQTLLMRTDNFEGGQGSHQGNTIFPIMKYLIESDDLSSFG